MSTRTVHPDWRGPLLEHQAVLDAIRDSPDGLLHARLDNTHAPLCDEQGERDLSDSRRYVVKDLSHKHDEFKIDPTCPDCLGWIHA